MIKITRSSSPRVKPHWGPSVCVFVPCERVEDGGRAHVGYGVNDFVVTFSSFWEVAKKHAVLFEIVNCHFCWHSPKNKASYPKLTEKTGVGKCSFLGDYIQNTCIPLYPHYIYIHIAIDRYLHPPWYFHDT